MTSCGEYNSMPKNSVSAFKSRSLSSEAFSKKQSLKSSNAAIRKIALGVKNDNLSIMSEELDQDIQFPDKYTTEALNYRR